MDIIENLDTLRSLDELDPDVADEDERAAGTGQGAPGVEARQRRQLTADPVGAEIELDRVPGRVDR